MKDLNQNYPFYDPSRFHAAADALMSCIASALNGNHAVASRLAAAVSTLVAVHHDANVALHATARAHARRIADLEARLCDRQAIVAAPVHESQIDLVNGGENSCEEEGDENNNEEDDDSLLNTSQNHNLDNKQHEEFGNGKSKMPIEMEQYKQQAESENDDNEDNFSISLPQQQQQQQQQQPEDQKPQAPVQDNSLEMPHILLQPDVVQPMDKVNNNNNSKNKDNNKKRKRLSDACEPMPEKRTKRATVRMPTTRDVLADMNKKGPPPCARCKVRKRAEMHRENGRVNEAEYERWARKPGGCMPYMHNNKGKEAERPRSPLTFTETATQSPRG